MNPGETEIIEGRDCEVQRPSSLAPLPVTMLDITVVQAGQFFEVWVRWGKKNWQVGTGTLEEMLDKRDRLLHFISDSHAPLSSSVAEFVELARGL